MWVEELRMRGLGKRRRREDVTFRKLIEPVAQATVMRVLAESLQVGAEAFGRRRSNSALRAAETIAENGNDNLYFKG